MWKNVQMAGPNPTGINNLCGCMEDNMKVTQDIQKYKSTVKPPYSGHSVKQPPHHYSHLLMSPVI